MEPTWLTLLKSATGVAVVEGLWKLFGEPIQVRRLAAAKAEAALTEAKGSRAVAAEVHELRKEEVGREGELTAMRFHRDRALAQLESFTAAPVPELLPAEAFELKTDESLLLGRGQRREEAATQARQASVEGILHTMLNEPPPEGIPSGERIDPAFLRRWADGAQDAPNDDEVRKLWARLLAGELVRPGSFSPRAIDVLRTLTPEEAKAFNAICSVSVDPGYLLTRHEILLESPLDTTAFRELEGLVEAGLLKGGLEASGPFDTQTHQYFRLTSRSRCDRSQSPRAWPLLERSTSRDSGRHSRHSSATRCRTEAEGTDHGYRSDAHDRGARR